MAENPVMAKRVADEVFAVGRQLGASPKELLAAAMTGIVESGFRNLPGGDADSQGWRQERASLYKNPTNVQASARRFFQEAKQFNRPGISAGDLAARVQRPAAQYRGRYSQVRGQAQSLLGGAGGGGGGGSTGGGSTSSGGQTTTSLPDFGSQQSQLPLVQALLDSQQASGPPAANIQAPSFSAHPVLPEGFGTVSGGGGPAPKADIGALAAAVKTLGGDVPASQSSSVVQNGRVLPTDSTLADAGAGQSHSGGASSALSWARSKVGAPGSQEAGGENHGKLADFLNSRFGMSGQPWCAMFTSAAVTKGGAPSTARTASVAQVRQKAQQGIGYERGFVHGNEAKPGDLILFGNDHIGMVESVGAGRINYVGGNQSDGVHEGVASARGATVVRPKYGQRRR